MNPFRILLLLLAVAVPQIALAAASSVTLIKAARLIDGNGGAVIAPAMVRIEGERIIAVGTQLEAPPGAHVIDLGAATLLPGLIDLHTHLTNNPDVHWQDTLLKTTPAQVALWGARNALVTLQAGFTTCRDMGADWPYTDVALREAIEQDVVPGPRLFVAGNYVSSTGGAGDGRQFSLFVDVPSVRNLADGPVEIVKAVRTNFKYGADFIKVLATGAITSDGIAPGQQQYSDEELQAAVTEAKRWGRRVAAHAHGAGGIKASIRAGVWTIDHGSMLDEEAIGLLKGTKLKGAAGYSTYFVPTLYVSKTIIESSTYPESQKERTRQNLQHKIAAFRQALAAGLPIGFSTDVPLMPHGQNAKELTYRVSLGESPLAAIVSATRINAEILGWSDRIGTLEAGKWADIVAVPGDPLQDITAVERVGFVMKGGMVYKNELSAR